MPNGPRTNGGLTSKELQKPENSIYLCRNHHKIIDSKSQENKYTPDLLIRMKNLHEFKISGEIGEYLYPLNWISSFSIEGGIFKDPIELTLGKVTFVFGNNGIGKSALVEIFQSVFAEHIHERWNKPNIFFKVKVGLENPAISIFESLIGASKLSYIIKTKEQPFVPFQFQVIALNKDRIKLTSDHLDYIAKCIGFTRESVTTLLKTTSLSHGLLTNELEIKTIRTRPYVVDQVIVTFKNGVKRSFASLSGTEQARVILDIVISYATEVSRYRPTLLLIDWIETYSFSDGSLSPYLKYLQSSNAHFQTLFVSHNERPDLDWSGWVLANMIHTSNGIKVIQTEKY